MFGLHEGHLLSFIMTYPAMDGHLSLCTVSHEWWEEEVGCFAAGRAAFTCIGSAYHC
jgi:hypothetical protein